MSRRQTLPPAARDILAEIAKRLRGAPARADRCIGEFGRPGDPYPIKSGCYEAVIEGAASDLERLLAVYAPKGGR